MVPPIRNAALLAAHGGPIRLHSDGKTAFWNSEAMEFDRTYLVAPHRLDSYYRICRDADWVPSVGNEVVIAFVYDDTTAARKPSAFGSRDPLDGKAQSAGFAACAAVTVAKTLMAERSLGRSASSCPSKGMEGAAIDVECSAVEFSGDGTLRDLYPVDRMHSQSKVHAQWNDSAFVNMEYRSDQESVGIRHVGKSRCSVSSGDVDNAFLSILSFLDSAVRRRSVSVPSLEPESSVVFVLEYFDSRSGKFLGKVTTLHVAPKLAMQSIPGIFSPDVCMQLSGDPVLRGLFRPYLRTDATPHTQYHSPAEDAIPQLWSCAAAIDIVVAFNEPNPLTATVAEDSDNRILLNILCGCRHPHTLNTIISELQERWGPKPEENGVPTPSRMASTTSLGTVVHHSPISKRTISHVRSTSNPMNSGVQGTAKPLANSSGTRGLSTTSSVLFHEDEVAKYSEPRDIPSDLSDIEQSGMQTPNSSRSGFAKASAEKAAAVKGYAPVQQSAVPPVGSAVRLTSSSLAMDRIDALSHSSEIASTIDGGNELLHHAHRWLRTMEWLPHLPIEGVPLTLNLPPFPFTQNGLSDAAAAQIESHLRSSLLLKVVVGAEAVYEGPLLLNEDQREEDVVERLNLLREQARSPQQGVSTASALTPSKPSVGTRLGKQSASSSALLTTLTGPLQLRGPPTPFILVPQLEHVGEHITAWILLNQGEGMNPFDAENEDIAVVKEVRGFIQPQPPTIKKLEILSFSDEQSAAEEQGTSSSSKLEVRAVYIGGREGASRIQWYRTKGSDSEIIHGAASKVLYPSYDDIGWDICCSYTPVRDDGCEGPTVTSPPATVKVISDHLQFRLAEYMRLGGVEFTEVEIRNLTEAIGKWCTLIVNKKKLKLRINGKTKYKTLLQARHLQVSSDPNHPLRFTVSIKGTEVKLQVSRPHYRNLIVLTLQSFLRLADSKAATAKTFTTSEGGLRRTWKKLGTNVRTMQAFHKALEDVHDKREKETEKVSKKRMKSRKAAKRERAMTTGRANVDEAKLTLVKNAVEVLRKKDGSVQHFSGENNPILRSAEDLGNRASGDRPEKESNAIEEISQVKRQLQRAVGKLGVLSKWMDESGEMSRRRRETLGASAGEDSSRTPLTEVDNASSDVDISIANNNVPVSTGDGPGGSHYEVPRTQGSEPVASTSNIPSQESTTAPSSASSVSRGASAEEISASVRQLHISDVTPITTTRSKGRPRTISTPSVSTAPQPAEQPISPTARRAHIRLSDLTGF